MSKRKRRHRKERNTASENNNIFNNNPFGINPNQLMGLLGGNFDFNQIGNLLSSMNGDGMNLNNFNLNTNHANRNQFDFMNNFPLGNFNNNGVDESAQNNTNVNELEDEEDLEDDDTIMEEDEEDEFIEEDENIQMLIAIKSIVDSKKANFIERIIEEYSKGTFK